MNWQPQHPHQQPPGPHPHGSWPQQGQAPQGSWQQHPQQRPVMPHPQAAPPPGYAAPPVQHGWATEQHYSAQYVPTQAQPNPTSRPMMRTWILIGVATVGFSLAALFFALYFGLAFGIVATFLALLFALIPLGIVIPVFLWLDRFEAEPWRYLITAFLWGALGSTLMSLIFNSLGTMVIAGAAGGGEDMIGPVVVAPLVEETFKGAFLLVLLLFARKEFDGLTDGIVYAGIVAAGFAFTENILYLGSIYTEAGGGGLVGLFILRGLLSPFCHPMFTTMIGIGVGVAATTRSTPVKIVAPFIGWCGAVLLHGLWNLGASTGFTGLAFNFGIGFFVFLGFLGFVIWTRSREGKLIGQHLAPYGASGWLAPAEISMLGSMKHRRQARHWARTRSGSQGVKAMRAFQDTATELAMLRARMHRHEADAQTLHTERVLLDSMTARRREFSGMPVW